MHNWRSCFVTGASFLINPHQMQSWLSTWRLGSWLLPNNCHLAVAAVYPLSCYINPPFYCLNTRHCPPLARECHAPLKAGDCQGTELRRSLRSASGVISKLLKNIRLYFMLLAFDVANYNQSYITKQYLGYN